jgi:hypothetical protein
MQAVQVVEYREDILAEQELLIGPSVTPPNQAFNFCGLKNCRGVSTIIESLFEREDRLLLKRCYQVQARYLVKFIIPDLRN